MRQNFPSETITETEHHLDVNHAITWWSVKVICGAMLIASLFLMVIYRVPTLFEFPTMLAQLMVVSGASVSIWHYLLLKRRSLDISQPGRLLIHVGLFRWLRHPMYAADLTAYTGLYLLMPNLITSVVLAVAWIALIRQAKTEDAYLAKRFTTEFKAWRERTRLIVPFLY